MARPTSVRWSLKAMGPVGPVVQRFAPHLRQERGLLAGGTLALFAEVAMRLLEPWPLKLLLDRFTTGTAYGVQTDTGTFIILCALAMVVFSMIRAAAAYASTVAFALAGNRILTRVRHELFLHLQQLQGRFHDRARSGDVVMRVMGDVGLLKDVLVTALLPLGANLLILVGMLAVMFWLDPGMTLLALLLLPLFAVRMMRLGGRIRSVARVQRKREGALAGTTAETMGAMQTVQALSLEDRSAAAFKAMGNRDMKEGVKAKRLQASLERSVDVLIAGSTALVLGWGAHRMFLGEITPGDLVVFLAYLKSAFKPIGSLAKYTGRLSKAAAAGERVLELLEEEPEVKERPDAVEAPSFLGDLRLDSVRFSYPGGSGVLNGVDLHLKPGEQVALVGPSGTGKSTLIDLLLRLRDPDQGRILFDGQDIRTFRLQGLRGKVSVLLQEPVLFATTIRENIACGGVDVAPDQMEAAARIAGAHGFIQRLPEGYDTVVGERGLTLSRGERQRIAIARMAVRPAPFIILDEPTTGLDPESVALVTGALARLCRGRTTLLITHDMQLALTMDRVVRLEQGLLEHGLASPIEEVDHALRA